MELPHRFVPTTSKFVSPVRIVAQTGHRGVVVALAFSPCHRYLAASDSDSTVKVWCIENLDVVGSYRIGFVADTLKWYGDSSLECSAGESKYQISFEVEEEDEAMEHGIASRSGYIPLLGAPEYTHDDEKVVVSRGGSSFEHPFTNLVQISMESCERYVVALSPKLVEIYGTSSDETLCSLPCEPNDAWRCFYLDEYGSYIVIVSNNAVWQFDPIKDKPQCIVKLPVPVTSQAFSKKGLVALGDVHGNITIVSTQERSIILRTPRFARSFAAVYPSPDKAGLIAIRDESVSAFMGVSQEILSSAPLPASLCASCAGSCYTECVVACEDDNVYRLKLDTNDIVKLAHVPEHLKFIHAVGEVFVAASLSKVYAFDGAKIRTLDASAEGVVAMALNESAKHAAFLYDNRVDVWDVHNNKLLKSYSLEGAKLIAFGKDKTADTIFAFNNNLEILSASLKDNAFEKLNVIDDPIMQNAQLLSVASAAKSFIFVLCEINHGQLAILRVGLNSGKSSIVLRVFVAGKQIWGAAVNNDSVQLREDATCLRIVQGLTTYSVEDWSRSEPLAIY